MKTILLVLFFVFSIACSEENGKRNVNIISPEGDYSFAFKIDEAFGPMYSVNFKGKSVIGWSGLGFDMFDKKNKVQDIEIDHIENASVASRWKPVYGEKNEYPDIYEEALIVLKGDNALYNLRVRAYNEGVAFRYEFRNPEGTIERENTEFSFPSDATAWTSLEAQSEIEKTRISRIESVVERPLLVQLQDSLFAAIGEAALVDFARMNFSNKTGNSTTLVSNLASEVVLGETVNKSPWRFVMAGNRPGDILGNNYLLLNLNEPNQIDDTSYIKPGKVIREITLGTEAGLICVDFAARHNMQYVLFDAGWYGNEYDDASDATTVTVDPKRSKEKLELQKVIDYGKSKGIGIILYVNRRALEKQLDEILPLVKEWGVSGLKYGFVNVGSQKWTSWLHEAIRKAADHELMVNVHDEYRPTGYSRTYPNFITQEGIRGDEESTGNAMVINTIFTRMIAGAGDQTNCYFAPRVTEKMGSHASQLAKTVCIYSPWQFLYWYDRPQGAKAGAGGAGGSDKYIKEVPELAWFDNLPTVWDDTKVLGGYPGEYAVIARKKGNDWFIGALSGNTEKDIVISLDFLEDGIDYEATIYTDDPSVKTPTKVGIEHRAVSTGDLIGHTLKAKNGLAIHLKPKQ